MLQHIMDDSTIPRNIRRVADETRQLLMNNSKGIGLRAAEAISKIDEISNDPNMPVHARTASGSSCPSLRPSRLINIRGFFLFYCFFRSWNATCRGGLYISVNTCSPVRCLYFLKRKKGPGYSPQTVSTTVRFLCARTSSSRSTTCCHVPSIAAPDVTGMERSGPTTDALT